MRSGSMGINPMRMETAITQIGQSGIARALAPIVVPAREIFREPADLLGVQQTNWAPVIADRIGSMIAPGWAASQYANEALKMVLGAAENMNIPDAINQILRLAPQILQQGVDLAVQIVGSVLSMTSIIGSLIGLLFDWIKAIFEDGPSQEEWDKFFEAFEKLVKKITGFEVYAAEAIKHHTVFERIIAPGFRLAPAAQMTIMMFDRPAGKPQHFPIDERPFFRIMTYKFMEYNVMIPGTFSTETGFINKGYSMVFPGTVPGGYRDGIYFARSLKQLSSKAMFYPTVELERYTVIPWWQEMWDNHARFKAFKYVFHNFPKDADSTLWEGLRNAVSTMITWAADPMGALQSRIKENLINETRWAQQAVTNGLASALNNLGDAQAMFIHTPDENQVYKSREGSAPYPGRKVAIVPRGSQRPPENLVALHWTSKGFDLYRGAAADNIIRGANRAAAQSARKTGDSRGGAALLALAAAGALIYANSRD